MTHRVTYCAIAALCAAILFGLLCAVEASSPRLEAVDGVCDASAAADDSAGPFLLAGWVRTGTSLAMELSFDDGAPDDAALLLPSNSRAELNLDDAPAQHIGAAGSSLLSLPAGARHVRLELVPRSLQEPDASDMSVFVGGRARLESQSMGSVLTRMFVVGLDAAAIFFALSLWLRKRSEGYLVAFGAYATFALLHVVRRAFRSTGGNVVLDLVFDFPLWGAITATGDAALASMWVVAVEFCLRYLVLRTFLPTRLGKVNYVWVGLGAFAVCVLVATFSSSPSLPAWASFAFRMACPLIELAVIVRGFVRMGARDQAALVTAWFLMLPIFVFNWAGERGLVSTYSLGARVGLGGIVESILILGLLFAICMRFSGKFAEAEALRGELEHLNASLELAVEQKTAELTQSLDALREEQGKRDEFLSNVAHNIKTPLFSVAGYTEMASSCLRDDPERALGYLGIAHENVDRAQATVRNLLLATRLENRRLQFIPVRLDLGELLSRVVQDSLPGAQERGVRVELRVDEGPVLCRGDGAFLAQAFQNVVDNAVESCDEGGHVWIEACEEHGYARVCVRDDGCGIPAESLPHVFDRYWSSRRDRRDGTGLGLSITRDIVEQSGGLIGVRSEPGEGSTFTIDLPLAKDDEI